MHTLKLNIQSFVNNTLNITRKGG